MTEMHTNSLPFCFTRYEAVLALGKSGPAIDSWIKRALARSVLILLKKGLYIFGRNYLREPDKRTLLEFLASRICEPSYISLEYAMMEHGLLSHGGDGSGNHAMPITSLTTKTGGNFTNYLMTFSYINIKSSLFFGFEERKFRNMTYGMATKAKALFDYLYLRRDLKRRNKKRLRKQLFEEFGVQWLKFSEKDFEEFGRYVWKSNSTKMITVWEILKGRFDEQRMEREFSAFRRELLGHD